MASPPSIAIVGAGPAGLSLARLLQVSAGEEDVALNVTIFERDASPSSRIEQGGTLDLHPNTGLAAIKAMNIWDEFQKFARYEGEELAFADKNGMEFVHMKEAVKVEGFDSRPEIDRERLKEILLQSVDSKTIQWGKQLRKVTEGGILTFADESTAGPFDLIVGADGGWSRVAHVLTDVRPTYSGVTGFQMNITRPNEDYPAL